MDITADTKVDQIVKDCPGVVGFLIRQGLPCVVCGEPFWGSLADLARQKKWDNEQINKLVEEVRKLCK